MASTVLNSTTILLSRGKPAQFTGLTATTQVFQFTASQPGEGSNGLDCITISIAGITATSPAVALEGSLDGGASWFGMTARTGVVVGTGQLNSDPAVTCVASYDVSGLGAGCLFRVGISAFTSGTGTVTILQS